MKKIYFATSNSEKIREAREILGIPIEPIEVDVDEVQSMDLEYVARKKVESMFERLKKPVIVDDVGVYINSWNGFPGPFIKFLDKARGNAGILKMMQGEEDRSVTIQSAVGYHDGKKSYVFVGEIKGRVSLEEKGNDGWGFDPIMMREGEDKTIAELGFEHKNKVSHRAKAFAKLKEFLDSQEVQNKV